jgi:hypothetical protein
MVGELLPYGLMFARTAVGLVFVLSVIGKLRDLPGFVRAVAGFALLSQPLVRATALLFLAGEVVVVGLLLFGGPFLAAGFGLALGLLLLFSLALTTVLIRGLQTPCHCFGASEKAVSGYDLWRNLGFVAVALLGLGTLSAEVVTVNRVELGLVSLMAAVCIIFWARLGEVLELLYAA